MRQSESSLMVFRITIFIGNSIMNDTTFICNTHVQIQQTYSHFHQIDEKMEVMEEFFSQFVTYMVRWQNKLDHIFWYAKIQKLDHRRPFLA